MHDRGLAAGRRIACRVPDFRIGNTAQGDSLPRWPSVSVKMRSECVRVRSSSRPRNCSRCSA